MSEVVTIRQGDFGRVFIRPIVVDENDAGIDLSTATSIAFSVRLPKGGRYSRTSPDLVFASGIYGAGDGTDGALEYALKQGDSDQIGRHHWEVEVVWPDGQITTESGAFDVVERKAAA